MSYWSVDRWGRQDAFNKCFSGLHIVEASSQDEAIRMIEEFAKRLQTKNVNWWPRNPHSCLNGPFNSREEALADCLRRHPDETLESLQRFAYLDQFSATV